MEWMLMPLRRYAEFSGRSRRKEYWMFTVFVFLVSLALMLIEMAVGMAETFGAAGGPLSLIFSLATLIPSISVSVRRLHDIDRTGWWLLAPIVPLVLVGYAAVTQLTWLVGIAGVLALIGLVMLLVFAVTNGTPGPNRFGPDPKDPTSAEVFA
ncbi:MAG: DUF805 domain-containing protein [Novosphingobium sp.]|nr:DUF805 domain-containing protein [Novosphingobium sp.]